MKSIKLATGTGFYGDSIRPAIESVKKGNIDYLCFDALSELTMAILQKDYKRDSTKGFTKDFESNMRVLLPLCLKNNVKIMTNAGGVNPYGAKRALDKVIKDLGLDCKIAVVSGDNIMGDLKDLDDKNLLFTMQDNKKIELSKHDVSFANAYIGAEPLVNALEKGADIVISGRTTDAAQFAAPLMYEFDWSRDDWDIIAKGMTVGHLMECSSQATGGNFSGDWKNINLFNVGYPIAQVYENGEAIISKTPESGGSVSKDTLKEQLLYEVHDPFNYILPDVVVNIADTKLEDVGDNKVRVYGTTGKPATKNYKALIGYNNGYMGEAIVGYSWPDALDKARCTSKILIEYMKQEKVEYYDIDVSYLGYDSLHKSLSNNDENLNEVYLRIAIHTETKEEASRLGRLLPQLSLGGPPSASGFGGQRKSRSLFGLWSVLIPKSIIDKNIKVEVF